MARNEDRRSIRCSFCGKPQSLVERMIAGNNCYICDDCVRMCASIVGDENPQPKVEGYDGLPLELATRPKPMQIKDIMPALRSTWFALHIGSAAFSYGAFILAGCIGLRYLLLEKKDGEEIAKKLQQMDYLSYRLAAFGFLFLTIVILSGAIWAEQAWSAFWTWDPKEVWALITWIIYAVYLHLRLRSKRKGVAMAWFLVIAVPVVFFTFAGVNTLLPGLHSYG